MLEYVTLFLFALFVRGLLRIFFRSQTDFDTYFHLYLINYIREYGVHQLIDKNRFIRPFSLNYPWMLHFILSYIPRQFEWIYERYFSVIIDALFTVIIYALLESMSDSSTFAWMGSLLYLFTPVFFTPQSTGPRIKSLTPRTFGEILGNLVFVFMFMYLQDTQGHYLFFAVVLAVCTVLSSKFAMQALFFISLFSSIILQDALLVTPFVGGVLGAMLLSKGKYYDVMRTHMSHLKNYFFNNLRGETELNRRNSFTDFYAVVKSKSIKEIYLHLFYYNSLSITIIKYPIFVLALVSIIQHPSLKITDVFIISSLLIFLLSSLKWFLFIGESERYLNYVVVFVIINALEFIEEREFIFYALLIYGLVFHVIDYFYLKREQRDTKDDELIQFLKRYSHPCNVLNVPFFLGGIWRIVYETKHNVLHGSQWINGDDKKTFYKYMLKYPVYDLNRLEDIIKQFDLDIIIVDKAYVTDMFELNVLSVPGFVQIDLSDQLLVVIKQELA